MITKEEIDAAAERFDIHASHVQRDYVHGWILARLFSASDLASCLILKGGNCLRKGYFPEFRYSGDLDFTTPGHIENDALGRELNRICSDLGATTGVRFDLDKTRVNDKSRIDDKQISEARLYFRDFYGTENEILISVRVDVTQFDRIHLPIQERLLVHPYSDADQCRSQIRCVKLEEVLATKMRCLLQRRHIADLFDLAYATYRSDSGLDLAELLGVFFRITVFGRSPAIAKGLFLDLPLDALGKFWTKYIDCPVSVKFTFETAKARLLDFVERLIPGRSEHERSQVFFPSKMRNPIMEAADSLTLLRMLYKGSTRLIEPYALAFKTRKDGQSREYLYAYDTTGGNSGPGLKSFLPGEVDDLQNTDQTFAPRHEVHLRQAGGSEKASHFEGTSGSRPRTTSHYVLQCMVCNKRFYREKSGTAIRAHKSPDGWRCSGRRGFYV